MNKEKVVHQNKLQLLNYSVIAFALLFVLNKMTFYTADDYTYRFIYKASMPYAGLQKIDGIKTIVESQISHYQLWNGRFVAHSIVQFFMQYNKNFFNIFNSLAFIFLALLIYKIVVKIKGSPVHAGVYLLILLLLWGLLPELGKTILWVSGSGNYLWTALFYTMFILCNYSTNILTILFGVTLGFISGATNENSAPATIIIVAIIILYRFIKNKELKLWQVFSELSACIGFLVMMKSPGSQARGKMQLSFWMLKKNLISVYQMDVSHFFFAYLLLIILVVLLWSLKKITKKDLAILSCFLIGHFAGIYSLVLSPEAPLRTFFGPAVFLILLIAYFFSRLEENFKLQKTIFCILLLYTCLTYSFAVRDIHRNFVEVNQQVEILETAKRSSDVKLKILSSSDSLVNPYNGTLNLSPSKDGWFNSWMARYFDVKSITGIPRE